MNESIEMQEREFPGSSFYDVMEHDYGPENQQRNIPGNRFYNAANARRQNFQMMGRSWAIHTFRDQNEQLDTQTHVDQIVTCLEKNNALMEDNIESEALRKNALRDMPQNLTIKRCVKKQLSHSVSLKSKRKPIGCFKKWKYSMSISCSKFKSELKNFMYTFELWYNTLKQIEGHFGSSIASYFKFFKFLFLLNCFVGVIPLIFIMVPQLSNLKVNPNAFNFMDIFTGEGSFTESILYYGKYSNSTVNFANGYYMPYGYFFTMLTLYLVMFIIFSVRMARSYRHSFIETKGGLKNVLSHKIFCGWDYQIATKETAELKSSSIYQDLKVTLRNLTKQKKHLSCLEKFQTIVIQIIANIFVVVLLSGMGYLLWNLLNDRTKDSISSANIIVPAVIINAIILLLPTIFAFLVRYEDYSTSGKTLFLTLLRIFAMQLIIIGVLMSFWLENDNKEECWETNLAQEVYRLIIFDFLFTIILQSLLFIISKYILHRLIPKYFSEPDFDIAMNALNVIYNQSLLWIGLFFSPILPIVVILKMFITWYVQSSMVLYLYQPTTSKWRASNTSVLFYILSFISLFVMIALLGYMLLNVQNSANCGPLTENIFKQIFDGEGFWEVVRFIARPGVFAVVLIALLVAVYYQYKKSEAQKNVVQLLKEMLVWQAKDKEFLLQHISKINGKWQYKLNEGRQDKWNPITMTPVTQNYYSDDEMSGSSSGELYLNPKKYH